MSTLGSLQDKLRAAIYNRRGILLEGQLYLSWANGHESRTIVVTGQGRGSHKIALPEKVGTYSWPTSEHLYEILILAVGGKKRTLVKQVL